MVKQDRRCKESKNGALSPFSRLIAYLLKSKAGENGRLREQAIERSYLGADGFKGYIAT